MVKKVMVHFGLSTFKKGQILIDASKQHILINAYTMSYLIIIVFPRDASN